VICWRIALMAGDRRNVKPTAATRPARPARSAMACPSATDGASGFSHRTCLPASSRADDLAVQAVGHHDADRVDVGRRGDGLPAGLGPLVAVAPRGIGGERLVGIGDGHQPNVG
jgi:hypothetical protein